MQAEDSVVRFNELMYHPDAPGSTEPGLEWIELHNSRAVDVDMSGWRLSAGVEYTFAVGTVIPARGYLVVAANPTALGLPALGPWTGRLSNDGERLELKDNNDRVMDEVDYGTGGRWTAAPDGGGFSLSRRGIHAPTGNAESWTASRTAAGTPGVENFATTLPPVTTDLIHAGADWKYEANADPGVGWEGTGFGDGGWANGAAAFHKGGDPLPAPASLGTALPTGSATAYFRHAFPTAMDGDVDSLRLRALADDGAAFYLNGAELARLNLPPGPVAHATSALAPRRAAPVWTEFDLPGALLDAGETNVLAVSLHQAAPLPGYAEAVIAAGPVAYWRFGEPVGQNVLDLAHLLPAPELGGQDGAASNMDAGDLL